MNDNDFFLKAIKQSNICSFLFSLVNNEKELDLYILKHEAEIEDVLELTYSFKDSLIEANKIESKEIKSILIDLDFVLSSFQDHLGELRFVKRQILIERYKYINRHSKIRLEFY